MLHEIREYYIRFDAVPEYLDAFERALPAMKASGFRLEGAWLQELGPRTGTTFVWMLGWKHLNERADALTAFRAHADFPAFADVLNSILTHIDTRILRDVLFSPMAGNDKSGAQPDSHPLVMTEHGEHALPGPDRELPFLHSG